LVYKLYELTDDEIAIVESSTLKYKPIAKLIKSGQHNVPSLQISFIAHYRNVGAD